MSSKLWASGCLSVNLSYAFYRAYHFFNWEKKTPGTFLVFFPKFLGQMETFDWRFFFFIRKRNLDEIDPVHCLCWFSAKWSWEKILEFFCSETCQWFGWFWKREMLEKFISNPLCVKDLLVLIVLKNTFKIFTLSDIFLMSNNVYNHCKQRWSHVWKPSLLQREEKAFSGPHQGTLKNILWFV